MRNLSDHVEVVLHTDIIPINILGGNPEGNILTHSSKDHIKPKVRWDKCDLQLYSDILQAGLQKIEANGPSTLLEIDLSAMALNKLLYDASVASTPKKLNGARNRSRLPVWNDTIAVAVRLSKLAHTEWKEAGSPTIATDLLLIKKKAARRAMRQTIRQQNYLQMQEKYTELMLAKEMDTKIFYKLVHQQRSIKNTATEVLHFEDQTFSSTEGIASAFSDHFQKLATPAESEVFDENYTNQVTFDKLLMESMAAEQPRNDKPVSPKEVFNIVRSFKLNKAQDVFGLSAEHLKNAPDELFSCFSQPYELYPPNWPYPTSIETVHSYPCP